MGPVTRREAVFPASLVTASRRVESRIVALLDDELRRWTRVDPALATPLSELRAFVAAGGKRLRPAFCHCGFIGAGGDPEAPIVTDVSAALELIHTFALVHDDIMDGSRTRRGRGAVHERFASLHASSAWRGEARRFGDGLAILVGDFAFVYADTLMRGAPRPALDVFDTLRAELCVGQALDLVSTARGASDLPTAERIATYKSAKYTVERPLHLGAALADALDRLRAPLSAVGLPLGAAFQLRDDVLGAFGDASVTGKPVGDDLREGKATPLVALAHDRGTAADRAVLRRLGALDFGADDVAALQEVLVRTGALDAVELEIARLAGEARAALGDAPVTDHARSLLDELVDYVAWRDR